MHGSRHGRSGLIPASPRVPAGFAGQAGSLARAGTGQGGSLASPEAGEIKVGIVGLREKSVSEAHALAVHGTPGLILVACADTRDGRAQEWAREHGRGCAAFTSLHDMATALDGRLDAVILAVPDRFHAALAIEAMREFGLYVLVEKPPTETLAEAEEMVAVSRKMQRPLLCGTVYVHSYPHIRQAVTAESLGKLFSAVAWWDRRRGAVFWREGPADPFVDQGVHLIALLGDIFGWPEPVRLKAIESNVVGREATINVGVFNDGEWGGQPLDPAKWKGPDVAEVHIDFHGDPGAEPTVLHWTVRASVLGNYPSSEQIVAEVKRARGTLRIPVLTGKVDPAIHRPQLYEERWNGQWNAQLRQPLPPDIDQTFRNQARHWNRVIRLQEPPRVGGSQILWLMRIIDKYRQSVDAGGSELQF